MGYLFFTSILVKVVAAYIEVVGVGIIGNWRDVVADYSQDQVRQT